jgi:hypothetical protein
MIEFRIIGNDLEGYEEGKEYGFEEGRQDGYAQRGREEED